MTDYSLNSKLGTLPTGPDPSPKSRAPAAAFISKSSALSPGPAPGVEEHAPASTLQQISALIAEGKFGELDDKVLTEVAQTVTAARAHTAVLNEYELKGVEGGFTAQHFHHERGEQRAFGAMIVDRERLLFVPLSEEDRSVAGPARRVTAIDGTLKGPLEGMRSVASAKDFFRSHPAVGDFTFRPETYSRTEGAVEVMAASLMATLGDREERLAREAVAEVAQKGG